MAIIQDFPVSSLPAIRKRFASKVGEGRALIQHIILLFTLRDVASAAVESNEIYQLYANGVIQGQASW